MAKRRHKLKSQRTSPVVRVGELATPERRRKQGGVMTEVVDRDVSGKAYIKRHRVRIECMLDHYFHNFRISDHQYMAGLKYREIYLRAMHGYSAKVLCNPFLMEAGQADPEGKMLAHIDCGRWLEDANKILAPAEQAIVRNVCGYDSYAGGRDNKNILMGALDKLAVLWGYATPEKPHKRSTKH
jgi:hypothetical protein